MSAQPVIAFHLRLRWRSRVSLLVGLALCFSSTHSYEVRAKDALRFNNSCTHESLAQAAERCMAAMSCTVRAECDVAPYGRFGRGVRWNDDPQKFLDYGSRYIEFARAMKYGKQVAAKRPLRIDIRWSSIYRSHFGDLQFLHAMARHEEELAGETREKMLVWAEFTYRVWLGEIPLETKLSQVQVNGIADLFRGKEWTVRSLFSMNCATAERGCRDPGYDDQIVRDTALGSLLHMIQDSYSGGHTERGKPTIEERENGRYVDFSLIRRFHSYARQDDKLHGRSDARPAWAESTLLLEGHNPLVDTVLILQRAGLDPGRQSMNWAQMREFLINGPLEAEDLTAPADYRVTQF